MPEKSVIGSVMLQLLGIGAYFALVVMVYSRPGLLQGEPHAGECPDGMSGPARKRSRTA
jgi:hypothetical protein